MARKGPTRLARWGNDLYTGKRSYDIVGRRRLWYLLTIPVVALSVVAMLVQGINPSIDFRGGTEFTVIGVQTTEQQPAIDAVASVVGDQDPPRVSVVGGSAIRVQTGDLERAERAAITEALAAGYGVDADADVDVNAVGPTWGADVTGKALRGLVIFLLLAMLFMTVYFRAWRMATAAIVSMLLDLLITVGVYAAVGWEVSPATVIGLLTILSYSIYDTVVVFDKVRENTANVLEQRRFTYAELVNLAVNQTLVRSLNTSVVALLPVGAILFIGAFLLGAGTLRDIALALFVGMGVGTVLSVIFAAPFQVTLRNREPAIAEHTAKVLAAREASDAGEGERPAPVRVGALVPGEHRGVRAQPRRKRRPGRPAGRRS